MDPDTRGSGGLRMLFRSPTSEPGRFFAKDPCVIRYKGRGYLYFSKQLIEENGYDRFVIGIAVSENLEDWEEAGVILPEQEAEGRGLAAPGAIVWTAFTLSGTKPIRWLFRKETGTLTGRLTRM